MNLKALAKTTTETVCTGVENAILLALLALRAEFEQFWIVSVTTSFIVGVVVGFLGA